MDEDVFPAEIWIFPASHVGVLDAKNNDLQKFHISHWALDTFMKWLGIYVLQT